MSFIKSFFERITHLFKEPSIYPPLEAKNTPPSNTGTAENTNQTPMPTSQPPVQPTSQQSTPLAETEVK